MDFFEEMVRDMDLRQPRIILTEGMAVLENVSGILMLSETAVTVSHGWRRKRNISGTEKRSRAGYTTVTGTGLMIKEICEGRILVGGKIQRAEFLQPQGSDSD